MACYDFKGQQLLDVCRELDIAVPEQVAVIGVDNDARLCRLCTPPLSSVIPDTHRTGYEAAQLLDRMMRGEKVGTDAVLIPPLGIAERQSSDVYAIDDADIASALRFIREHACEGISVADLLRVVPLSRRMLEHRFLKLVRRTPHAEIIRIRMERAGRLSARDRSVARRNRQSRRLCRRQLSLGGLQEADGRRPACLSGRDAHFRRKARGRPPARTMIFSESTFPDRAGNL